MVVGDDAPFHVPDALVFEHRLEAVGVTHSGVEKHRRAVIIHDGILDPIAGAAQVRGDRVEIEDMPLGLVRPDEPPAGPEVVDALQGGIGGAHHVLATDHGVTMGREQDVDVAARKPAHGTPQGM